MTIPQLSDRELHVLQRAAQGEIYDRIAADLGVTGRTVKQIASKMFAKLGARSMPHAVLLACQAGFLDGRPRSQRHGDHGGYTQHQKRGEDACAACKAGERAYQVERRLKRRQEPLSARHSVPDGSGGAREGRGAPRASEARSAPAA